MSVSEGDILTEATEGICWHKNNWTKSKEDGLDSGVPEFLKVTLKRASNKTQHRGLHSDTSSESLEDTGSRKNRKLKENFEGKSMHGNINSNYVDVVDFGDGLTQKLRSMSACSGDAISVNIGTLGDSTNCISDYGEGTRQKMERGFMKGLDGTNNFSVEVGEGNDGINHTLDFGEGTMEKSEVGHLKPAVEGRTVSISDDAEDQAFDAALRSSSWMTRQQLEGFVRLALRDKEARVVASSDVANNALVDAVVAANFEVVATKSSFSSSSSKSSVETESHAGAALERLVRRMNGKMKRMFVVKATSSMTKEQMRDFVLEAYDARERGSVTAAIVTMNEEQIRETLAEMTATMDADEKRDFAAESVASLDREALEKIFDRAAKTMTKEEFQSSLTRLEEEVEEAERMKAMEKATEKAGCAEVFAGGDKVEISVAGKNEATNEGSKSHAAPANDLSTPTTKDQSTAVKAEMKSVRDSRETFLQCAAQFRSDCRAFQEETLTFKQQVSLYKEESSSFKQSVATFQSKTASYKESEERLRQQLSAASCERPDCQAENEEMVQRIRELTVELAEAKTTLMEASAKHVIAVGESTMKKLEETRMTENGMRKEMKRMKAMEEKTAMEETKMAMEETKMAMEENTMTRAEERKKRSVMKETKAMEEMTMEKTTTKAEERKNQIALKKTKEMKATEEKTMTKEEKTMTTEERTMTKEEKTMTKEEKTMTKAEERKNQTAMQTIEMKAMETAEVREAKVSSAVGNAFDSDAQSQTAAATNETAAASETQSAMDIYHRKSRKTIKERNVDPESAAPAEIIAESSMDSAITNAYESQEQTSESQMRETLESQVQVVSESQMQMTSESSSQVQMESMRESQAQMESESHMQMTSESQMETHSHLESKSTQQMESTSQMHMESRSMKKAESTALAQSEARSKLQTGSFDQTESQSAVREESSVQVRSTESRFHAQGMSHSALEGVDPTLTMEQNEATDQIAEDDFGEATSMAENRVSTSPFTAAFDVNDPLDPLELSPNFSQTADDTDDLSAGTESPGDPKAPSSSYSSRRHRHQAEEHSYEEKLMSRERTLSWEHQDGRSIRSGEEMRLEADEGKGSADGICWHHINYKSVEDEKNQPEFLKAKLKKTSFGPTGNRRKSSGSDTSSR